MAYPPISDKALLGADWYYNWSTTPFQNYTSGFIPMLFCGSSTSGIPANYSGTVLVFNEPNVDTQCDRTAAEAVADYLIIRAALPYADLIPGGSSVWANTTWLQPFVNGLHAAGQYPRAYHIHAYVEYGWSVAQIQTWISQAHTITGTPLWITEFNAIPGPDPVKFQQIYSWIKAQSYIEKYAPYTNRQMMNALTPTPTWQIPGMELVNNSGTLTSLGVVYAGPSGDYYWGTSTVTPTPTITTTPTVPAYP